MAKLQKVEGQIELKCHADKFFEVWCQKPYLVSKLCPKKFPKIELHEGDWHKVGGATTWNYVFNEIAEQASVKLRVEDIDVDKRVARYSHHDGLIMKKYYNTFNSKIQVVVNNVNEGCIVKWSFEYEKMNENAPQPKMYIDFLLATAKDIDACCIA